MYLFRGRHSIPPVPIELTLQLGIGLPLDSPPPHITFPILITMTNVEIYTWAMCPFCIRAKQLLTAKGVQFTEYSIDGDERARAQMAERANGRRSVPQIFIDGEHIGGCDDLYGLDAQGKLDTLLHAPSLS
jgi:glutaredoxin 3